MQAVKEKEHHALMSFTTAAEQWLKRLSQLELTPVEKGFIADLDATHGAAVAYLRHGCYTDFQLFGSVVMCAQFSVAVMDGDADVYEHYFNINNELREEMLPRVVDGRLPLTERGDIMATRYCAEQAAG